MARFRLHCVVHRLSASGIATDDARIEAPTLQDAITKAESRARRLLAHRQGLAVLRDEAGLTVWSLPRRT